jgi:hypothetical protein
MKDWEVVADNLKKAGLSLGWCQLSILRGERSGLLTRIASTGTVLLFVLVPLVAPIAMVIMMTVVTGIHSMPVMPIV